MSDPEEDTGESVPEEDFGAMFEASLKAKRLERGDTVDGTIVAIGPEVAFVDVGGKGEAVIDIAELKNAEGEVEVAPGDRIQAMVVSTAGGLTLSRRLSGGGATDRQLEDAYQTRLPVEGKVERAVKGGYEVRIGRQRAFCPNLPDRRAGSRHVGPRRTGLPVSHHRIQGGRREPRRVAARAPRRGAAGELHRRPGVDRRRRGDDGSRHLRARVRRVRRPRRRSPGPAPRLRDGVVARGRPFGGREGRRRDHRQRSSAWTRTSRGSLSG